MPAMSSGLAKLAERNAALAPLPHGRIRPHLFCQRRQHKARADCVDLNIVLAKFYGLSLGQLSYGPLVAV